MPQADRLAVEMGINYLNLYGHKDKYFRLRSRGAPADNAIHHCLTKDEILFLACIALEMLEEKEQEGLAMGNFNLMGNEYPMEEVDE